MPEGNEVHRWAERHMAAFAGRKLHVEGPNGRFTEPALLEGRKLQRVLAVGKHLGYDFGPDRILHVHLGRFGDWTEGRMPLAEVRGALRLRMWRVGARAAKGAEASPQKIRRGWYSSGDDGAVLPAADVDWAELRGPTDCSVYTQEKWEALLDRLGPDPLGADLRGHDNPQTYVDEVRSRKTAIGELLMDQSILSGVGNIYRAEVLFRHRVSPFTPGDEMEPKVLKAIWKDLVPLMRAGMVDRRIVCTRRADRPSKAEPAPRGETHYVYRRHGKPCFVCGERILHRDVAGRTLYWCPLDQGTTDAENGRAFAAGMSLRAARAAEKRKRAGLLD